MITTTGRRPLHIVAGLVVFAAGVFLAVSNSLYVLDFVKGGTQPVLILIGLTALAAAVFNNAGSLRTINTLMASLFLGAGGYGLYDEYQVTMDFFSGLLPILLIVAGILPLVHGISTLRTERESK